MDRRIKELSTQPRVVMMEQPKMAAGEAATKKRQPFRSY
jgi:hypothetical protein